MTEFENRIVVCLRIGAMAEGATATQASWLQAILQRAVAHGGRLIAWLPPVLIFDFAQGAWEDALELLGPVANMAPASVGIAEGGVHVLLDRGVEVAVAMGDGIERARVLSRLAERGEVLVDRAMTALKEGRIFASGRRYARHRGRTVAGVLLDLEYPRVQPAAECVGQLSLSAWVGIPPEQAVDVSLGHLTLLHSPPGTGATRFFRELEGLRAYLRLGPGPAGEPLGALRRALAREPEIGTRLRRDPGLALAFERLVGGAGLRPNDASALVAGWCQSVSGIPVVFVEDPDRVDSDSLEALLAAISELAIVVRTRGHAVPEGFERVRLHSELELHSFSEEEASVAIQSMAAGTFNPTVAARFAKRGGYRPLGIAEAIASSLECGELEWREGRLQVRGRVAGRGRPRPASYWVMRRLERLDAESRRFLDALAVLGGEAEGAELGWLAEHGCFSSNLGTLTRALNAARWVRRSGDRLVSLSSDTLRRRLLDALEPQRRAALHRLIAEMYESQDRPLMSGAASLHAAMSGDTERAVELGRKVGLLCRVNQLEGTAAAFEAFARGREISALISRRLAGGWTSEEVLVQPAVEAAAPRPRAPVPSATRVAARVLKGSAEAAPPGRIQDSVRPRALPGEGRLAEVLESTEASLLGAGDDCRRLLATALWQARSSNDGDALLSSLEGLAVARRVGDRRGERACMTLALALSRRNGAEAAARSWEMHLQALDSSR